MDNTAGKKKRRKKGVGKGLYGSIGKGIGQAKDIANQYLDLSPTGKLDTGAAQSMYDQAGQRSGEVTDYLGRLKNGLMGYDNPELNALREQRTREETRGLQTGRAALARGQANNRLGSTQRSAQLLELAKSFGQSNADAENDLFIKGADEKRRALDAYGTAARGIEADEFGRKSSALGALTDEQKFNINQAAADRAMQQGGIMGIMGIAEARRNARQQNKIANKYAPSQGGGYHSSGGGGSQSNGYATALGNLIAQYQGGATV